MFDIISAIISAVSTTTNAKLDTVRKEIIAEGETSRAYIEGAEALNIATWKGLQGGNAINDILSTAFAKKVIDQKAIDRQRRQREQDERQRWIMLALIGAAVLIVGFIVLKD